MKYRSKQKNDHRDAEQLVKLLSIDRVPTVITAVAMDKHERRRTGRKTIFELPAAGASIDIPVGVDEQ